MVNVERPKYSFNATIILKISYSNPITSKFFIKKKKKKSIVHVNVPNNMGFGVETNPFHSFLAFIFYVLIGFLQVSYPDNPTAFHVHPKTMFVSISSFLLYCFLFWIKIKFMTTRIDTLIEVFGSLSIISLVLMFLPDSWGLCGYIIIYTIWLICHVLLVIIRHCLVWIRPQMRKKLPSLLPSTSIELN